MFAEGVTRVLVMKAFSIAMERRLHFIGVFRLAGGVVRPELLLVIQTLDLSRRTVLGGSEAKLT